MNLLKKIGNAADEALSNFSGSTAMEPETGYFDGYDEDFDGYDGYGDDLVDFDGVGLSFAQQVSNGRRFTVNVVNALASDEEFIMFPSYVPSSVNLMTDGAFLSIAGNALNANGKPKTIKNLQNFLFYNPGICLGLKITSTQAVQLEKEMTITPKHPYGDLENRTIFFADWQNENTFRDKVVTINEQFHVDNQHEIKTTIVANSTLTMTFYFGAILNTAKSLAKKNLKASNTIAVRNQRRAK
jgi:hypothetical protein